jgi:hypothetical protein
MTTLYRRTAIPREPLPEAAPNDLARAFPAEPPPDLDADEELGAAAGIVVAAMVGTAIWALAALWAALS